MRQNQITAGGLPSATLKVFLTANLETRASRRCLQLGINADSLPQLIKDMEQRDQNDSSRTAAPLEQAEDAVFVDCSNMGIEQVTSALINLWKERERSSN